MADLPQPAPTVRRYGLLAYAVAAGVALADQASKLFVLAELHLGLILQVPVFLPFFKLSMVWNPGVSFSLLRADTALGRWLLVAFAGAVVTVLAVFVRKTDRLLTAIAIGMIMGGAIGNNLIDRIRFGAVADFLDFSGCFFPWVFNLADSAITLGVVILLIESFQAPKPKPEA